MEKQADEKASPLLGEVIKQKEKGYSISSKKVFPIENEKKDEANEDNIMILNIFNPDTGEYVKKAVRRIQN